MSTSGLQVVSGEGKPRPVPKRRRDRRHRERGTVERAAARGRRELLVATRNKIARAIDEGVAPRDLASLTKRLDDLTAEIEEIDQSREAESDAHGEETPTEDQPWEPL